MIDGKIAGMDCFGKPETFSSVSRKLIGSYALDAVDWLEEGKEFKVLKSKVTKFLMIMLALTIYDRSHYCSFSELGNFSFKNSFASCKTTAESIQFEGFCSSETEL